MDKHRSVVLIFLFIAAFTLPAQSRRCAGPRCMKRRTAEIVKFFHVSDIHLDPFYNQSITADTSCRKTEGFQIADYEAPYGRVGCDSPEWLWGNALAAMKEKGDGAKFMLLTGRGVDTYQTHVH